MDICNELMQYAEQFDDPSDSDGEGVTHEDQEPECDPEPPASSSSSSSRKPAPKGPRGVTSKTRVSPPNHGPGRATVVYGMQRSRAWCGTPPILGVVNMVGTRNFTCYMGAL